MAKPGQRQCNPGPPRTGLRADLLRKDARPWRRPDGRGRSRDRAMRARGLADSPLLAGALGLGAERHLAAGHSDHAVRLRSGYVPRALLSQRENLSLPHLERRRASSVRKQSRVACHRSARFRSDGHVRAAVLRRTRLRVLRRKPRHARDKHRSTYSRDADAALRSLRFDRS